ncbi:MAG: MFS transporter, partial [Acidobacteria bacterium]|nr:MFS transporter [Acidobacteriota bacterium]
MTSSSSLPTKFPRLTRGTTLVHIDFLITGIVMTFLGPMLPALAARWSLNDNQSGALIFAQFFSSMFGMLLSGILVGRWGYRLTLMTGLVLMPCGMVLIAFGPWLEGMISICILGVGYGITTPAGNLRTAEVYRDQSASALNVINAVWGVGAMSSPFLLALALGAHKPWIFLFSTAAALLLLLLVFAVSRFHPDQRRKQSSSANPASLWATPVLPLVCLLFFVYVGTETSLGSWVAMYARRLSPPERSFSTITPSFFWGAILAG